MDDPPIRHVADTADWVAAYRAVESERSDALFHDPLAGLLAGDRGREIAAEMGATPIMAWSIAIRTVIVDGFVAAALDQGVDAVLNLGAGLDTRPYRMALPPDLLWIEADFPQVLERKEQRLAGHAPRCRLERTPLDLAHEAERQRLFRALNARAGRVLVITEGVVPYLTVAEAGSIASDLAAQPHMALWITDYFSPLFMQHYRKGHMRRPLGRNAPFRFDPDDWAGFFAEHGWQPQVMRYLAEEGHRVGRPSPLPWPYRLLLPLLPRAKREAVNHMTGYALLERPADAPEADLASP